MSLGPAEGLCDEVDEPDHCSECGREPRKDEHTLDEWHVESDGIGGLHAFCPECWDREFGAGRID